MRSRGLRTVTLPSAEAAAILKKMRGEVDSNSNYRTKSLIDSRSGLCQMRP